LKGDVLEEKATAIYPSWRDIIEAKRKQLPRRLLDETIVISGGKRPILDQGIISSPYHYYSFMEMEVWAESIVCLTELKQRTGVPLAVEDLTLYFVGYSEGLSLHTINLTTIVNFSKLYIALLLLDDNHSAIEFLDVITGFYVDQQFERRFFHLHDDYGSWRVYMGLVEDFHKVLT
jgi:hypothetical protein